MADHYYSLASEGAAFVRDPSKITVGTSATGGNPIELRITDAAMTAEQVYAFLEWLADLVAIRSGNPIVSSGFKAT